MTDQAMTPLTRYWEEPLGRFRLRPAEGWLTLAMVVLLVETFVWSLQDAGWVPDSQGSTASLVYLALGGILIELVGAKLGWGRWRTHLAAGVVAGLVLPPVAGFTVLSARGPVDVTNVAGLYRAAGDMGFQVWADLVRDNRPFTTEYGHYHMIFGGLAWAAGMLASSAIFQRRRPFDAVVIVGLLLITSMWATSKEQLPFLVLFTIAALVLLVRAHSFDEQITWIRRRIGDPAAVSGLYLRGGASFIGLAVIAALMLTYLASSAPLQGLWADLPSKLSGLTDLIEKIAPQGGNPRPSGGASFQSTATTIGVWSPATGVAFQARVPVDAPRSFKWRAGTYSAYDGLGRWSWGDTKSIDVDSGLDVLADTSADPAKLAGRVKLTATIVPEEFRDPTILGPDSIVSVDRKSTIHLTGDQFTTLAPAQDGGGSYTITALMPDVGGQGGPTANHLRVTPRVYPATITKYYLGVPAGSLGPNSEAIYADVKNLAKDADGPADNPYDFAKTLESYLRSSRFDYQSDVRDRRAAECGGLSSAECFATIKEGYCEYYATLMTLLLRQDHIPARIAYGFLNGGSRQPDGTEVVPAAAAHWWVEAYFATYGWVEFDPTGGTVGQPQTLPAGPVETAGPLPTIPPAVGGGDEVDPTPRTNRGGGEETGVPSGTSSTNPGPFVVVGVLLALGILLLAIAARRRGPGAPMDPDRAWGGLGRLAARFGFGPRPAQTVYEYAGALGDAVPTMRAELSTVARAKVEVAYGRQTLTVDRMRTVGDAYRRVRLAILRQGLRRWPRRGR